MLKRATITILCFFFVLTAGQTLASQSDNTLVIVSPWEAKGIDPAISGFVFTRMGCVETLTTSDGKGGIEPKLAKSWSVSQDKTTWTFILRDRVLFHDGTLLTGETVVKALNRVLIKKKLFKGTPVESFTSKGQEVIIKTSSPFAALPAYLSHYSTGIIAPTAYNNDGSVNDIIGTGFYRLVATNGRSVFDFEAFDKYWGEKATIQKSRYLAIPNGETRALMAESGEADICLTLSATAAERLKHVAGVSVISTPIPRVRLLKLNANLGFFDTIEERLALSFAIDREGISRAILKNPDTAATQLIPEVSLWHNTGLEPLAYNPKKAIHLLEKAGWKKNADGIYAKNGTIFAFELITYSSRPMLPVVAEALNRRRAHRLTSR